ncbi:hypothetical protein ACJ41O_014777 [Fusarium nematophilum]
MRLLNTDSLAVEEFADDAVPRYAILSHAWEKGEVTFQDMEQARATSKDGYRKVKKCCSLARSNGFDHVWIDTCCIDKTSSAELSEAINSMYRWYQEATICYGYLADVSSPAELPSSRWFTRGWTLQELIAPSEMIFFNRDWEVLGTKESLNQTISACTGIPEAILSGGDDLETASIAQRMSWAAERKTTRTEDRAYCLLGIFGINMPLLYGEREKAFLRLQEEIMRVSDDHSLFAWRCPGSRGGLLATSPEAYKDSGDIISWNTLTPYNSPFTLTNKGVHLEIPFIGMGERGVGLAILPCTKVGNRDELIGVFLRDPFLTMEYFERCKIEKLELIDLRKFSPSQYPRRSLCVRLRGGQSTDTQDGGGSSTEQRSRSLHPGEDKQSRPGKRPDPQKLLLQAAKKGKEGVVEQLLALPCIKPDFKDVHERTALSYAAKGGHERVAKMLLDRHDVDINSKDKYGYSPLGLATREGKEGVVWLLLSRSDIETDAVGMWGLTVLSVAARLGHAGLVSQLLARRDTRGLLVDCEGLSTLSHAARAGQEAAVRLLLGSGKIYSDFKDKRGRTALWHAASEGQNKIVKLLLETGRVNPSSRDVDRVSPLVVAALMAHESTVALLLSNGAKLGKNDARLGEALSLAITRGHGSMIKMLLENGANPDALMVRVAAWRGHETIVKMMLDKGATPPGLEYAVQREDEGGRLNIRELIPSVRMSRKSIKLVGKCLSHRLRK